MNLRDLFNDWSDPIDNNRNELVFENRNKAYGAYMLRRDYDQVLMYSVLGGTSIFILLLCVQFLFKHEVVKQFNDTTGCILKIENVTITKPIDNILEPKPKVAIEQKASPAPKLHNTVKGTNPYNINLVDDKVNNMLDGEIVPDANADKNATNLPPNDPPLDLNKNTGTGTGGGEIDNGSGITSFPDVMPEPMDGMEKLINEIRNNVVYPHIAKINEYESKVFVKFVVEKDGSIGAAEVIRGGTYESLNREAIRVIQNLKPWKPGKSGGKPVRVYFTIPINFVLAK